MAVHRRLTPATPTLSAVAAFLFLMLTPSFASACACCDSVIRRHVLGWANDGRVVVERRGSVCGSARMVEWIRPKENIGEHCQCWNSDVEGACEKLQDTDERICEYDHEELNNRPFQMNIPMRAARFVKPSQMLAIFDTHGTEEKPTARIRVALRAKNKWIPFYEETISNACVSTYGELEFGKRIQVGVSLAIDPADHSFAMLILHGIDTRPGYGRFESLIRWVKVPPKARNKLKTNSKEKLSRAQNIPR